MSEYQVGQQVFVAGVATPVDGAEVENQDIILAGQQGGLAVDRTLAELFRVPPLGAGNVVSRGIIPTSRPQLFSGAIAQATVQSSGATDGSIHVFPFRAVVGSRVSFTSNSLQYWRDIRSGVFADTQQSGFQAILLAPNVSGNPRWDLVYAIIQVDQPSNPTTRRLKDPNTGVLSVVQVFQYVDQPVSVSVVTGTPAGTPVIPTIPNDSGNTYYVPLAAVHVPNGFGATSTVAATDVRGQAKVYSLAASGGVSALGAATGNNDTDGTYTGDANFRWTTKRPSVFLPPDWTGGRQIIVEMDITNSAHPSHANGSIVDSSVDWRNRMFLVTLQVSGPGQTNFFGNDPNASLLTMPGNVQASGQFGQQTQMGNSFQYFTDATFGAGLSTVAYANHGSAPFTVMGAGNIGIYVDANGVMRAFFSGTPQSVLFAWIQATAQFPNA